MLSGVAALGGLCGSPVLPVANVVTPVAVTPVCSVRSVAAGSSVSSVTSVRSVVTLRTRQPGASGIHVSTRFNGMAGVAVSHGMTVFAVLPV